MTKAKELRDMADEQIRLVWKDAAEKLFRLRIQAQTEKIAAPSDLRKNRRTIARCQTILAERGVLVADAATVAADGTQHESQAPGRRAGGRPDRKRSKSGNKGGNQSEK
jgi:large subunit ribosomal protein L29